MASEELRKHDAESGGNIIVESEHAHIHRGKGFTCSNSLIIANDVTEDNIIWVPAGVNPHMRVYRLDVDATPFDITAYEGPFTIVNSGMLCPPKNLNRASSNVSSVGFSVVASVTLVVGSFTQLSYQRITAAKQTGGSEPNAVTEWILKSNTEYLIRNTNVGAGAAPAGIFLFWYE